MKYSKNIIATVLICAVASTFAFAATKSPTFKLDDKTIKCKIENGEIWVRVPKNFVMGTLVNETARQESNKEYPSYKSIIHKYSLKLEKATAKLINELRREAQSNTKGTSRLYRIYSKKNSKLYQIYSEGSSAIYRFYQNHSSGRYSEYSDNKDDLYDFFTDKRDELYDIYTDIRDED